MAPDGCSASRLAPEGCSASPGLDSAQGRSQDAFAARTLRRVRASEILKGRSTTALASRFGSVRVVDHWRVCLMVLVKQFQGVRPTEVLFWSRMSRLLHPQQLIVCAHELLAPACRAPWISLSPYLRTQRGKVERLKLASRTSVVGPRNWVACAAVRCRAASPLAGPAGSGGPHTPQGCRGAGKPISCRRRRPSRCRHTGGPPPPPERCWRRCAANPSLIMCCWLTTDASKKSGTSYIAGKLSKRGQIISSAAITSNRHAKHV